jgi:integrase
VPDFLIEAVRDYLAENPPASDGRILHRGDRPVEHIILNKVSHDAARRAGLPPVTFHSLRHTCAALLIKSGAQPKQIQAYMGHSSIGVTMDVYGHLFDSTGEDLAVRMTALRVEALSKVSRLRVL